MPLLDSDSGEMTGNWGERNGEWHSIKVPGQTGTADIAVHGQCLDTWATRAPCGFIFLTRLQTML